MRYIHASGHGQPVYLLRNNLKPSFGVVVLQLESLVISGQHTALKDDGHVFALDEIVVVVQVFGYGVVYDVIEVVGFIYDLHFRNLADTGRVYLRTVQTVLIVVEYSLVLPPD